MQNWNRSDKMMALFSSCSFLIQYPCYPPPFFLFVLQSNYLIFSLLFPYVFFCNDVYYNVIDNSAYWIYWSVRLYSWVTVPLTFCFGMLGEFVLCVLKAYVLGKDGWLCYVCACTWACACVCVIARCCILRGSLCCVQQSIVLAGKWSQPLFQAQWLSWHLW